MSRVLMVLTLAAATALFARPVLFADPPDSLAEIVKRAREAKANEAAQKSAEARRAALEADAECLEASRNIRQQHVKKENALIHFDIEFNSKFDSASRNIGGSLETSDFMEFLEARSDKNRAIDEEKQRLLAMRDIDIEKAEISAAKKKLENWDPSEWDQNKRALENNVQYREGKVQDLAEKARNHAKKRDENDRSYDDRMARTKRALENAAAKKEPEDLSWMRGALHRALYGGNGHGH